MPRDINLGPTGGPFINLQENNGDLDISNATNVDLNGATLTNANVGGFDSVEVFEADGTFDASNVEAVFVECVGGGGGSSGIRGVNGGCHAGGGGGGGGYAAGFVDVSATSSVPITIGTGGAGGASGNNAGGAGSNTSFGTNIEASGGEGGSPPPAGQASSGGGVSGDILTPGGEGCAPYNHSSAPAIAINPPGGGTAYAEQSTIDVAYDGSTISTADAGRGFGGGGDGPAIVDASISESGASGADGIAVVYY
jgi:hypothetical protein